MHLALMQIDYECCQKPQFESFTSYICLCVYKDMVVPEPGEAQQSVCEAVGGSRAADVCVSD